MKKKIAITVTMIVLFSFAAIIAYSLGSKEEREDDPESSSESAVSGSLDNGLRILPVKAGAGEISLTVYRGDYIVIKADDGKSHRLVIPSLDYDSMIPVPDTEKPYIKMKVTGEVEFTLDDTKGTINVIDFGGANYQEVSSMEAAAIIKNIDPFILDVRTIGEYEEGHLENSFLLPVQVLEKEIAKIAEYNYQPILIYCRSGNRSTVASKILLDAGFTSIYNLRDGMKGWEADGYPVVKD